jgi:IS30 family transposase
VVHEGLVEVDRTQIEERMQFTRENHRMMREEPLKIVYLKDGDSGSNENTNGLLRQYFPRGTDFSRIPQSYLNAIALRLNQRPRKTLGFETPADRLQAVLH